MNTRIKELIKFIKSLDIIVNTNTKARGHKGFFLNKKNRIDISNNLEENSAIYTLLHEFSHYIHSKLETNIEKNGGTLEKIFNNQNPETNSIIKKELINVTHWVDKNSNNNILLMHKNKLKTKIKELDTEIKKEYPQFQRSKKFKEFEKIIKKSNAKYLLKYDRIKVCGWFFQKEKIYTIDNIEQDFPELKPAFVSYIRLRSFQKKQNRISKKINTIKKYYEKPTELFARFIEGYYKDKDKLTELAPTSTKLFNHLLYNDYYGELKKVFELLKIFNNEQY